MSGSPVADNGNFCSQLNYKWVTSKFWGWSAVARGWTLLSSRPSATQEFKSVQTKWLFHIWTNARQPTTLRILATRQRASMANTFAILETVTSSVHPFFLLPDPSSGLLSDFVLRIGQKWHGDKVITDLHQLQIPNCCLQIWNLGVNHPSLVCRVPPPPWELIRWTWKGSKQQSLQPSIHKDGIWACVYVQKLFFGGGG